MTLDDLEPFHAVGGEVNKWSLYEKVFSQTLVTVFTAVIVSFRDTVYRPCNHGIVGAMDSQFFSVRVKQ